LALIYRLVIEEGELKTNFGMINLIYIILSTNISFQMMERDI